MVDHPIIYPSPPIPSAYYAIGQGWGSETLMPPGSHRSHLEANVCDSIATAATRWWWVSQHFTVAFLAGRDYMVTQVGGGRTGRRMPTRADIFILLR